MRAATAAGVPGIVGECGGVMSCGTCHVYVCEDRLGALPPPTANERAVLDVLLLARPNSRLSCQIRVEDRFDGLVIHTPQSQG